MAYSDDILSFLSDQEDRDLGERILDKIDLVKERNQQIATKFLNPHQQKIAKKILEQISEINFKIDGGYSKAERKRILIFPDYLFPDHQTVPLAFYQIEGNFDFVNLSHRDFLGAIMGLGVQRDYVGDIIIFDDFAQVIVGSEITDEIELNLTSVNEVPIKTSKIERDDIKFKPENHKEILATVASMRLDAIISAGFGESRSRSSQYITSGKIKLNWKEVDDVSADVEVGDMISFKGRGRLHVAEKRGKSNRGRIKLKLERIT
ncbi:photosystem II S4 domain protein [Halanaerobiaceae bacterium Z-7014]|uniref:Photosystem II S4 domain protein n=1 Tax=Halonatronomonas betaini TaxID=2778430 RepID=A0A931AX20_9FIRM|nr:photosystem II S4 domain protein [Halonatronomonas betaini]MBF8437626.1 photosystem II S4 domain protein [Halonatronomonas betaini]